ncbi:MAG: MGMT family protein [Candidatus Omnitrophica bacterium]|nr:MGMT family protein [Candidatus Omnitrophota bacterium]
MKNKHKKKKIGDKIDLGDPFSKVLSGLTEFSKGVLRATYKIPLGQTRSYQWVASKIGRPKACRAVGAALKKNPYPLLIPCHRVVRINGEIGGYSRGIRKKKDLLAIEKEIAEILKKKKGNPRSKKWPR